MISLPPNIYIYNFVKNCRSSIMSLNNNDAKDLLIHVSWFIDSKQPVNFSLTQYPYHIAKDLCLFKMSRYKNIAKRSPSAYIVFDFINGFMDQIDINNILHNKHVTSLFPSTTSFSTPGVSFKYSDTIRSDVVNYKHPDGSAKCECAKYPSYVDPHHKHVVTGDLNLIQNTQLRLLLSKGLNFRECQAPDKQKVIKSLNSGLDSYISKMSTKLSLPGSMFTAWKVEFVKIATGMLNKLPLYKFNNVLSQPINKSALRQLQKNFVFSPVDKAACNISIVCKQ